jgi:hypothetical protein
MVTLPVATPASSGGAASSSSQATDWPLAPGEVVVLWACVPPRARYVGYTPYIHTVLRRSNETANGSADGSGGSAALRRYTVFASLGDTASAATGGPASATPPPPQFSRLNSSAGALGAPGALPFSAETALLMGASPAAVAAVRALLAPLLMWAGAVNVLPVPAKYYDADATYSLYQRYALPEDPSAWAAWAAAPPVSVWSVTPALLLTGRRAAAGAGAAAAVPALPGAFPPLPVLLPKQGTSEAWLAPAADALASRLAAFFAAAGAAISTHDAARANPLASGAFCVATATNCGGDNRDTTYVQALPTFVLPADATALVIVVGVNHVATGNAHYANVAVYDTDVRLGVTAAADDALSVAPSWLRGTPHEGASGQLYALALSRTCPPWLPLGCLRVPSLGWPSAPEGDLLSAVERPYAAQDTTVGPAAASLVLPRLVLVNIADARFPARPAADAAAGGGVNDATLREQVQAARAGLASLRTPGALEEAAPAGGGRLARLRGPGGDKQ